MKKLLLLAALLSMAALWAAAEENVYDLALSSETVGAYECLEISFQTDAVFANPYDPDDIDIHGVFTTPSGQELTVNAFYRSQNRDMSEDFVPDRHQTLYDYDIAAKRFVFAPNANEGWAIRFSWNEIGVYRFRIEIVSRAGKSVVDGGSFSVTESAEKGPLTIGKNGYLVYRDDGGQFIPLGMNNAQHWDTFGYSATFRAIAANGGNYARVWSGTDSGYSSLTIENWNYGVGIYNLDMTEAFDRVLVSAREKGVKVQLCFDSFTALSTSEQFYGQFHSCSIYNKQYGGYISQPEEFWTSEGCVKTYKNRVRYLMARCGWDTNIAVWELMNEVNGTNGMREKSTQKQCAAWCEEMRAYIRSLDPYDRPVGISYAEGDALQGYETLLKKSKLDYVQVHKYDCGDVAGNMKLMTYQGSKYAGTVFIGEFGLGDAKREKDKTYEYLRIGLWSGLHAGSQCVPMYWWDSELAQSEYAAYLQGLRRYIDAFDFVSEPLSDVKVELPGRLKCRGLINKSGTEAILYLSNGQATWAKPEPEPVREAEMTIQGLKPGPVTVSVWDTRTGEITSTATYEVSRRGKLTLTFDTIVCDVAVMVQGGAAAE